MRLVSFVSFAAAVVMLPLSCAAVAQNYPVKPVRIVVPVAPGGGLDTQGRLLSKKLQETMGQAFVIDNRPGANAMIGTEIVVRSPADGHTLLLGPNRGRSANASRRSKCVRLT